MCCRYVADISLQIFYRYSTELICIYAAYLSVWYVTVVSANGGVF